MTKRPGDQQQTDASDTAQPFVGENTHQPPQPKAQSDARPIPIKTTGDSSGGLRAPQRLTTQGEEDPNVAQQQQQQSNSRQSPSSSPVQQQQSNPSEQSKENAVQRRSAATKHKKSAPRRHHFDVESLSNKDIESLRRSLKRYVKGKPTRRFAPVSAPALILQGFSQFIKIICLLLAAAIFLTGGIGIGTVFGYVATTKPLPADLLKSGTQTSYVYDIEGNVMAKFTGAENIDRVYIPYNAVQDTYIDDAFIAIEDERFETNIGIDPKRILSAVVSALANHGEATHGGSTITQQTVKLITGDNQRSAQRKVQEWYKAVMLNQQLTKWEIMELYLNLVPMANSYVGIETASRAYFGKSASDLSLAECAYLAGIPKSPSTYNPWTESGRRNGMRRQRIVLSKMYEIGKISLSEYRDALETELIFKKDTTPSAATQINSYFTEYAVG
ncbi:MAG TPA: transglycosylase domain-containing protein, partial [Clostridiaceae bacterium]|nr:transglycosylase domain-containing protein [Clostridiaceae bacterium]